MNFRADPLCPKSRDKVPNLHSSESPPDFPKGGLLTFEGKEAAKGDEDRACRAAPAAEGR